MLRPVLALALALGLPVVSSSSSSSSTSIRGVAPSDQQKFLGDDFLCVVGGQSQYLPISRVNDDFCDCDDGSDEPGTAACSYVTASEFYCANDGFFSKKVGSIDLLSCFEKRYEEMDGVSVCPNSCAAAAEAFRKDAKERLEVVRSGFEKRQAIVDGEIVPYFTQLGESETSIENDLVALKLLMDRVTVHKEREELRETRYRLEVARKKQENQMENGDERAERSNEQSVNAAEADDDDAAVEFETLDATLLADDDAPIDLAEDLRALEVLDSSGQSIKSLVELPGGTRVSLADYLRMDHKIQAPTKKLWTLRKEGESWQEVFLGYIISGEAEGRKRIGLAVLRVLGIIVSPLRALAELILYSPRVLWRLLSTPEIAGPVIDKFPNMPSPSQSAWFRRLGGGRVYNGYNSAMWAAQVVWDAPIYAYHYLFPTLDSDMNLPVAESLRLVLREIQSDITKLERDRSDKREAASIDYGPDRAYFTLKDKCIERRIEKYDYKFCAFSDVKQDHTTLGKWDGWAVRDDSEVPSVAAADYTRMRYSNGQRCYKGPERAVSVNLECGDKDEISGVDEPSTCVYVMVVRSPLACTARVLADAEVEAALGQ
uniref:Glucosidase 2 subunit beta n=1 Tax=Hyaloperonospora arabidopsidis (strain Emoy2) TaxID=559515 RepID=M4BVE8_HYAAE